MDLSVGQVVASRFRLERWLGEGGMGMVWAARDEVGRKAVALKFLKGAEDPKTRARFRREALAASVVRHAHVVQVFDVLEADDGTPVMVMELLAGESLAERLARDGRLPVEEVARILLPVISAVGTGHALGVVHRDLKPDNIFLCRDEVPAGIKVLDFGIAKLTGLEREAVLTGGLTRTGALMGTPFYMAPEQAFGDKDLDHRADIWSLGIVAYECLSGVLPTDGDNLGQVLRVLMHRGVRPLAEVAPWLPAEILDLVTRMVSRARDDRPRDLREVHAVLSRVVARASTPSFGPAVAPVAASPTASPPDSG